MNAFYSLFDMAVMPVSELLAGFPCARASCQHHGQGQPFFGKGGQGQHAAVENMNEVNLNQSVIGVL